MNECRIVPAIDLIGGMCVRLTQGDFDRVEVVDIDPVAAARRFADRGFGRLHLVDLDGARLGTPQHLKVLSEIAAATQLEIDYSGGLRTTMHLQAAFDAGCSQVVIGSAAVTTPELCREWFRQFGPEHLIIGLDVYRGYVRIKGWCEPTELRLSEVIDRYLNCGLRTVMSTDIARDGMLAGPSDELYAQLVERYPELRVIASGGIRNRNDIEALSTMGVSEAIMGKALYADATDFDDVRSFIW